MAGSAAFLRTLRGEDQGKGWELDPSQTYDLGRSHRCDLRVADPAVSATHARLGCQHGVWIITDLASTHGTRGNHQRMLAPKPLFDRDLIGLGKTLIEFRQHEQLDPEDLAEINRGVELPD
jgi:pSer/pThr/pTyr-binding forkhead associated (FHA) protein